MVVILTDETRTQTLSEIDAENCGYDISYMLFNKAKAGTSVDSPSNENTPSEPTTNNTDKNPVEKPSEVPTTSVQPNDTDIDPEPTTKVNTGLNDNEIPDTGVSKAGGIAVAALVVSGFLIFVLKKKKK